MRADSKPALPTCYRSKSVLFFAAGWSNQTLRLKGTRFVKKDTISVKSTLKKWKMAKFSVETETDARSQ